MCKDNLIPTLMMYLSTLSDDNVRDDFTKLGFDNLQKEEGKNREN